MFVFHALGWNTFGGESVPGVTRGAVDLEPAARNQ